MRLRTQPERGASRQVQAWEGGHFCRRRTPTRQRLGGVRIQRDGDAPPAIVIQGSPLSRLLQLRVLRLSFFQNGDVGIGVFPEGEEIFVGAERPHTGGIGIRAPRGYRLQGVPTSHS